MKKIIICLLGLFLCSLCTVDTSARTIIQDGIENINSAQRLDFGTTFNVIKGPDDPDRLFDDYAFTYIESDSYMWEGDMILSSELVGNNETREIKMVTTYKSGSLVTVEAAIGDYMFFKANYSNYSVTYEKNDEVDLYALIGYTPDNYYISDDYTLTYSYQCRFDNISDLYYPSEIDEEEYIEFSGFRILKCLTYHLNESIDSGDLHYVTRVSNPITLETILSSMQAEDPSGSPVDVTIEDNAYVLTDGKIAVGTYPFTIRAVDQEGNIALQECYIDVVDVEPPVIKVPDLKSDYDKQIISIFSYFSITDDSEYTVEYLEDEYTQNWNRPGTYLVSLKATDIYGNSAIGYTYIEVTDTQRPYLIYRDDIVIPSTTKVTKELLMKHIRIYDNCDGDITNYTIKDEDNWFSLDNPLGTYYINVTAHDSSLNSFSHRLAVYMVDRDAPKLTFGNYTILLKEGECITKEQALQILISSGQIESTNVQVLTNFEFLSEYSDGENEVGEYEFSVIDINGTEYKNKIKITASEDELDYSSVPSTDSQETNDSFLYGSIGGIAAVVLLVGGLGIVIYKKKH